MNFRVYFPFLAFAGLILIVGLACGTSTVVTQTAIPPQPTLPPSLPPHPTLPPQPTFTSTDTPAPTEAPSFFTDNFNGDLSNWTYNVTSGDANKLTISTDQGGIVTRLEDVNLAVYFYYNPYLYNDVTLDLVYRNQGRNSNNVNIVCRHSDAGWYEFTVQNDGLYQIWAYSNGYHLLVDGGSTAIRTGQASNEITTACVGNTLSLNINGVETRTITDSKYFLGQGQVGFGVNISALNPVTPVIVSFDSFTIAQP
jgi:hypothetical protein